MIQIIGTYHRSFQFPADLTTSFNYFRNIPHILGLIPHISLVEGNAKQHYRMLYHTTELRLLPQGTIESLASGIAEGFIRRSIHDFKEQQQ
jgi:hypothetical protein